MSEKYAWTSPGGATAWCKPTPADPAFKEPSGFAFSTVAIIFKAIAPHILSNRTCDGWDVQNRMLSKNGGPPFSQFLVHVALKTPIAEDGHSLTIVVRQLSQACGESFVCRFPCCYHAWRRLQDSVLKEGVHWFPHESDCVPT